MEYFFSSVALGFGSSSVCAAACLPVYLPFATSFGERQRFLPVLLLFSGRFIACVIVGTAAGALGAAFSKSLVTHLSSAALFVLAALLFFRASGVLIPDLRFCSRLYGFSERIRSPLLVGFLTGMSLCPPFLIAIAFAASSRSAFTGAVVFTGFFLGTSVLLTPLFFVPFLCATHFKNWMLKFSSVVACLFALFTLAQALAIVFPDTVTPPAFSQKEARILYPHATEIIYVQDDFPPHFVVYEDEGPSRTKKGYVVSSTCCDSGISGYGGPIPMLVGIEATGVIHDIKIFQIRETLSYSSAVFSRKYLNRFRGKPVDDPFEIGKDIDAVSGATITHTAFVRTLRNTVHAFSEHIQHDRHFEEKGFSPKLFDKRNLSVLILFITSIVVLRYALRFRVIFLAVSFLTLGLALNFFISITDAAKIAFGLLKNPLEYPHRFFIIGLALVGTILFGRHYCSFICPYGAMQELLYAASPVKRTVSVRLDRALRKAKYVILFTLPLCYALSKSFAVFSVEPFGVTFSSLRSLGFFTNLVQSEPILLAYIVLIPVAGLFIERFYCSYLCPLGALFAIISSIRVFPKNLFMQKDSTCAGCVKGMPENESECFICGGLRKKE
jgi:sulfite exporter TauE/SafE